MPHELCRHIKTNGKRCRSPIITGEFWCYFHSRVHFRHRNVIRTRPVTTTTPLSLPVLEDRESVQVAISLIAGALATGHLEDKRASTLLRAISLAIRNVGNAGDLVTSPGSDEGIVAFLSTLDGRDIAGRRMSDESKPPARTPVGEPEPLPEKPAAGSAVI